MLSLCGASSLHLLNNRRSYSSKNVFLTSGGSLLLQVPYFPSLEVLVSFVAVLHSSVTRFISVRFAEIPYYVDVQLSDLISVNYLSHV